MVLKGGSNRKVRKLHNEGLHELKSLASQDGVSDQWG